MLNSRRGQLVTGTIALLALLAVAWLIFVPAADWLARHDLGSTATGPQLQTARDAARGRLLTLGAGLLAVGALLYTARSFSLSREGQVTDRYGKAIEQLGSDKLDVRIGGIYALERIARDSAKDHPTVMEVLLAFIREHSREAWPVKQDSTQDGMKTIRPDVQAALTVVGRRNVNRDLGPTIIDLRDADLAHAKLGHINFPCANLAGANLYGTDLFMATLTDADLSRSNLSHADLSHADFSKANLSEANLSCANLEFAKLHAADLSGADLSRTDLSSVFISEVNPKYNKTNFSDADFSDATIDNPLLSRTTLKGAIWPPGKPAPRDWEIYNQDGTLRLKRVAKSD